MIFTARCFILSLTLLLVLMLFFFVLFSIVITFLGKERAGLYVYASRAFACLSALLIVFFSSSWCRRLAVDSDCGTPLTFHLTFSSYVYFPFI